MLIDESAYRNLAWSVEDDEGFEVFSRIARGETQYRYFREGTYTMRLTARSRALCSCERCCDD